MRPVLVAAGVLLISLTACDIGVPPSSPPTPIQPTTMLEKSASPTPRDTQTASALQAQRSTAATLTPSIPSPEQTSQVRIPPTIESARVSAVGDSRDVAREISTYFEEFYTARSVQPGLYVDVEKVRELTGGAYRDYAVTLARKEADDAAAGKLRELKYSNIIAKIEKRQLGPGNIDTAEVAVTRTKREIRRGGGPTSQTATIRFRLERKAQRAPEPDGPPRTVVATEPVWRAVDLFNPDTGLWISQKVPPPPRDISKEVTAFFQEFYKARSLSTGGKFNLDANWALVAFAYHDYTRPLLEQRQKEIARGEIRSISYSGIKTEVVSWSPELTVHGGLATVKVTRTERITRRSGADPPQTATYQFRIHRHSEPSGQGHWIAVDFLNPVTNKWLSESAGLTDPIPATHGNA
jgi:hypothetical protein